MRIIISPAKKMIEDTETLDICGYPVFLEDTKVIMKWIQGLSYEEVKKLWNCNDRIAGLNFERFASMELNRDRNLTPAILSYEGIQYQYMAPAVFEESQITYIQEHLRILSGFYGVLKPMDGVVPYRLEMQAKVKAAGKKNLYEFWDDRLYREILEEERVIINLASKEYSRCIEKYCGPQDRYITCIFGEYVGGKIRQKGTYAKMARGEMVRFLAERNIDEPDGLKDFHRLGYQFAEEFSDHTNYVFLK